MEIGEVLRRMARIKSRLIDPLKEYEGKFEFPNGVPTSAPITSLVRTLNKVPPPRAEVNLHEALYRAEQDAKNVLWTMKENPSLTMAVACQRNTYEWLRFWAVRWPDPKLRAKFAAELEEAEVDLCQVHDLIEAKREQAGA